MLDRRCMGWALEGWRFEVVATLDGECVDPSLAFD